MGIGFYGNSDSSMGRHIFVWGSSQIIFHCKNPTLAFNSISWKWSIPKNPKTPPVAILRTQKHPYRSYRFIHPSIGGSNDSNVARMVRSASILPTPRFHGKTSCWCSVLKLQWNLGGWNSFSLKNCWVQVMILFVDYTSFFFKRISGEKKNTHQQKLQNVLLTKTRSPILGGLSLFPVIAIIGPRFCHIFFSARESQPKRARDRKTMPVLGVMGLGRDLIVVRITSHGNPP